MNLYLTADQIRLPTGGGAVTYHESEALKELGDCDIWGRAQLEELHDGAPPEPWTWDWRAAQGLGGFNPPKYALCHGYAGTFGETVRILKQRGTKVVWTIAAHDRFVSCKANEELGIPFAQLYPHLVEEPLWQRYIEGYRLADVIICPSQVAADTVKSYGPEFRSKRIEVIPHGCDLPAKILPPPERFTVGYMGAYSGDKGVIDLFRAWKNLAYPDAVLVLAGRDSTSLGVRQLWQQYGGGSVIFQGWVNNVSDFYNSLSVYVQPSRTEGFGMEVLEAMAHQRPVVCSSGAGAIDLVNPLNGFDYPVGSVEALMDGINYYRKCIHRMIITDGEYGRIAAQHYTWEKVRQAYIDVWKSVIA